MLLLGRKVFAQCPKTKKIRSFPSQHFSSKLIPRTTRMPVFLVQWTFLLKFVKQLKAHRFSERACSPKKLLWKKIHLSLLRRKFYSLPREQFLSKSVTIYETIFFSVWKMFPNNDPLPIKLQLFQVNIFPQKISPGQLEWMFS